MNDNYRINCSFDSLNSINIIDQKSDIYLNNTEYNISTDSRCIQKNDIFIALRGRYSDGHNFLSQAFHNGASAAIISEKKIFEESNFPLILVQDTYIALSKIGEYNFKDIKSLKIAITGSVGKTTTKDYLKNILSYYEPTFAAPESFNNELGIVLSKAQISKMDKYAIFEIGMNMKNEISNLSKLINPDIAIITNIGEAHIGNLGSKENIAIEKSSIIDGMSSDGIVLLPSDSEYFELLQNKALAKNLQSITFGHSKKSDIQISKITRGKGKVFIQFRVFGEIFEAYSDMQNISIINNYLPVLGIAHILNYDLNEVLKNIVKSNVQKSRWQELDFELDDGQVKLIDDTYNASPTSMFEAIRSVGEYEDGQILRKIIIIGDMLELGEFEEKYHSDLVNLINKTNIDHVYFCGEYLSSLFGMVSSKKKKKHFRSVRDIWSIEEFEIAGGDLIFIKGGNKIGLNNLVQEFINYLALT
ncbi:MAG: hypothetical protein CML28_01330 [Rhizobiales bacterium]|nr:hypothetical protein [Hyphomicrobiales bacterium]|tara:strand:- start:1003 stop:2424 length:1422 start_codon:yes stop_codon:yes gene_type:complete